MGCALHFVDAGIDTGRLIAHIGPESQKSDDESTPFWLAVRDSAKADAEAIVRFATGNLRGTVQEIKPRESGQGQDMNLPARLG